MKDIKLDSILLFTLVTTFIMAYGLTPGETQYWYFGIIFVAMFLYVCVDIIRLKDAMYKTLKLVLLWFLIILVIGGAFTTAIMVRHKTHPIYEVHDIILQQEAAMRFLLDGKNPYATSYFGTYLEDWHYSDKEENPALYHFVMEPLYVLSPLPLYYAANRTVGYFDGRMPLLGLFVVLLIFASLLVKDHDTKRLFLVLLAFHPAMLPYTLEGRSDMYMYPFLFASFLLLYKHRYYAAGIPAGLAFAIKQSAWPVLPFYALYVYFKTNSVKKTIISLCSIGVPFVVIITPFLLWNSNAFLDSTVGFLMGTTEHSYPVAGYGLGSVLLQFGFIKDKFAYYPFSLWQAGIGIPLFVVLVLALKRKTSVRRMIFVYGMFLFVYWYLSRYFHNSHVGYISYVLLTAHFWPEDEEAKVQKSKEKRTIQSKTKRKRFVRK